LDVAGYNTLSGSVAGLTKLTGLLVTGSNTLSGDLGGTGTAAVVYGITTLKLSPCHMNTYTSGATWSNTSEITIVPSEGYGYSATEIDNMLIDMAASSPAGETITLTGSSAARTAASDAAVATLQGAGRLCTVVTNP
jgi:hypothetical protein